MKVRSLMNEENNVTIKNHIDGVEVVYGQEVEVSEDYAKMPTFKTMIKYNMIEEIVEEDD